MEGGRETKHEKRMEIDKGDIKWYKAAGKTIVRLRQRWEVLIEVIWMR
jgi:hypothetical protein